MDTSFWDDDEERVQIVYEDDQLPPVQAPQDGLPVTAATGMSIAVLNCVNILLQLVFQGINGVHPLQDESLTSERGLLKVA